MKALSGKHCKVALASDTLDMARLGSEAAWLRPQCHLLQSGAGLLPGPAAPQCQQDWSREGAHCTAPVGSAGDGVDSRSDGGEEILENVLTAAVLIEGLWVA